MVKANSTLSTNFRSGASERACSIACLIFSSIFFTPAVYEGYPSPAIRDLTQLNCESKSPFFTAKIASFGCIPSTFTRMDTQVPMTSRARAFWVAPVSLSFLVSETSMTCWMVRFSVEASHDPLHFFCPSFFSTVCGVSSRADIVNTPLRGTGRPTSSI